MASQVSRSDVYLDYIKLPQLFKPTCTLLIDMPLTQRENLPHEDTEGPDVTLGGVDLVENGLWRHPLERKSGLCKS